jgi:hypothetical protein
LILCEIYWRKTWKREKERKRILDYIVLSLDLIVLQDISIYREVMSSRQETLEYIRKENTRKVINQIRYITILF